MLYLLHGEREKKALTGKKKSVTILEEREGDRMNHYRITDEFSLNTFVVFAESEREAISKVFENQEAILNVSLEDYIERYEPKVSLETGDVIKVIHVSPCA